MIAAGGVYSAASASFTAPELSRQVKQGASNLIFCSEDAKDVAVATANECGVPLSRVSVISSSPKWEIRSLEGQNNCLPSEGKLDWERITDRKELEDSLICLLYSSGTTGAPKGHASCDRILTSSADTDNRSRTFTFKHRVRVLHPSHSHSRTTPISGRQTYGIPHPRSSACGPHSWSTRLLHQPLLHGRARVLDAKVRLPPLPEIQQGLQDHILFHRPSHLSSDCQDADCDGPI